MCDDLLHRDGHFARMRLLPRLAVHAQLHREMVRLGNLIGGDDVRPERAERINPLEKLNTPDFISVRWMSRAVMSLKITYPPIKSAARAASKCFPDFFMTSASSSS